jgi:hypothetical protein
MKRTHYQLLLFLIITFSICSNLIDAQVNSLNTELARKFVKQSMNALQEKAYLQTDKPYYCAGEDIWFKGYVVNATTHIPKTLSRYLYVELIDKSNTVITRVKIRKDSLGFSGHIKLKPEIQAGNYALRAYTNWMQNATPDFFFSRNINIANPIDDQIASQIDFGKIQKGKVEATIRFTDASGNPISGKSIDGVQSWDNPQNKRSTIITNKNGQISLQLSIDTTNLSTKFIDVSMSDPGNKYKNRFYLPELSTDFDVQFFPEGGTALVDIQQVIAFKAIGHDGMSVEIEGKVYTGSNEEVAQLQSSNNGMGKFSIEMHPGETYYVKVKTDKGIEKKFNLPVPQASGVGLHILHSKGKIIYEVINKTGKPNSAYYLLIHSRGKMIAAMQLNTLASQFSESILPAGITSFSVIDTVGNTYCERLFFVRSMNLPVLKMESDKKAYDKREPVDLKLNIQSISGKPVNGSFSISVTDSRSVRIDSLNDNILSYLLLSSDIKGYIEDPAGYFTNNLIADRERLDLLMLTQAWRRFNTSDVVKGKYQAQTFYMEEGQTLTGKVVNVFNKPSKKCGLIMISPYRGKIRLAQTDSLGRYLIDGIEFPDSTTLILKAKKDKSFGDVEVVPDTEEYPKSTVSIPFKSSDNSNESAEYLKQSKEKYYTDGGMRVVNLDVVTVKAAKKTTETHYYSGMEDTKFTAERLDNYPGMGILDVIAMMPGVQVSGEQVSIRGNSRSPLFMINEVESVNMDDINYLTTNDVEEISLFKGANTGIFGSKGNAGVIAITLKKGASIKPETEVSITTVTPLGFQKPAEFYMPKYEVDNIRLSEKSDLRTTIYWNPKLKADANGDVHVKFYTADKANDYSVVMEGIGDDGQICRYTGVLKRIDK